MTRRLLILAGLAALLAAAARPAAGAGRLSDAELTDETVLRSIERGREFLINLRNPDGSFTRDPAWRNCYTSLILMTLAYMGEHPNRDVMTTGISYLLSVDPARGFNEREGYAVPIRIMALAYIHDKLSGDRQLRCRQAIQRDVALIIDGQNSRGGWRYQYNRSDNDFSATQWDILALYEAARVGVEFPRDALLKARDLYVRGQAEDGGWTYQSRLPGYGSMTAAGVASLQIIADLAEPASGCPCVSGRSRRAAGDTERRIDLGLDWLARRWTVDRNPGWPFQTNFDEVYYWLYCVERVGIACGYKHFGGRNWYKEGAKFLVSAQGDDGSWAQPGAALRPTFDHWGGGSVPDTCYAILFLYKGRAPVLFNKLRHDGVWNPHRRDLASLTRYIERNKEQQFHWQIVDLAAPLEELHDAPVLFLCAETPPQFTPAGKARLREYTDTGGTLLVETSCGAPVVRAWFRDFAREVWPEWPLAPLGPDHPVFKDPYPLTSRPELMGIQDGLRTIVYFATDDVSCWWHTRAMAGREYLFQWGINLFTVAGDRAPLRAKLAGAPPDVARRPDDALLAGPRRTLRLARLRHNGDWHAGAQYAALPRAAAYFKQALGVAVEVAERTAPPVTDGGTHPADLAGTDMAYMTGTTAPTLIDAQRAALAAWAKGGGFVWAEAAGGAPAFDRGFRDLATQLGWTLRPLADDHPLLTGCMAPARGHYLAGGVRFRREVRIDRAGRPRADLWGVYASDALVGVYSPLDVVFSMSPYEAYGVRGYEREDAAAILTNLVLYLTAPPGSNTDAPWTPPARPAVTRDERGGSPRDERASPPKEERAGSPDPAHESPADGPVIRNPFKPDDAPPKKPDAPKPPVDKVPW